MKRVLLEVCPQAVGGRPAWKVTQNSFRVFEHNTQLEAIHAARLIVDTLLMLSKTVTLKIKRRDGTIRDERTYPRSSDPRRTKG